MKLFITPVLKITIVIMIMLTVDTVNAQKLPSVQKESVQAPPAVKIDGIPSEWDDAFRAYSNATEFKYLIANDKKNLFIVIQADYSGAVQKIVAGGITFTLSSADKKARATLKYPVIPPQYPPGTSGTLRAPETTSKEIAMLNSRLSDYIKEIPLSGMDGIKDSTISIYNEFDIKAAQHISDARLYTIELKIPLKYLQTVLAGGGTFTYKMTVNGLEGSGVMVIGGRATASTEATDQPVRSSGNYLLAPTYLTGSYTLAK